MKKKDLLQAFVSGCQMQQRGERWFNAYNPIYFEMKDSTVQRLPKGVKEEGSILEVLDGDFDLGESFDFRLPTGLKAQMEGFRMKIEGIEGLFVGDEKMGVSVELDSVALVIGDGGFVAGSLTFKVQKFGVTSVYGDNKLGFNWDSNEVDCANEGAKLHNVMIKYYEDFNAFLGELQRDGKEVKDEK